jgi:hypothetical protein
MHLAKFSLCRRPSVLISSNRFSTDFQPSLPPDVLSRKRRPRRPDCALECVRLRPRISVDTLDASRFIPDASRDGCFFITGGGGGSPSPQPPAPPSPVDDAISGERSSVPPRPTACACVRARSLTARAPLRSRRLVGRKFGKDDEPRERKRNVAHAAEMRAPNIAVHAPVLNYLNIFVRERIATIICACGGE